MPFSHQSNSLSKLLKKYFFAFTFFTETKPTIFTFVQKSFFFEIYFFSSSCSQFGETTTTTVTTPATFRRRRHQELNSRAELCSLSHSLTLISLSLSHSFSLISLPLLPLSLHSLHHTYIIQRLSSLASPPKILSSPLSPSLSFTRTLICTHTYTFAHAHTRTHTRTCSPNSLTVIRSRELMLLFYPKHFSLTSLSLVDIHMHTLSH